MGDRRRASVRPADPSPGQGPSLTRPDRAPGLVGPAPLLRGARGQPLGHRPSPAPPRRPPRTARPASSRLRPRRLWPPDQLHPLPQPVPAPALSPRVSGGDPAAAGPAPGPSPPGSRGRRAIRSREPEPTRRPPINDPLLAAARASAAAAGRPAWSPQLGWTATPWVPFGSRRRTARPWARGSSPMGPPPGSWCGSSEPPTCAPSA